MAVTIYVVLLRRGVPRWLAALAMGPVLLDAYQLQMEATIMPDVWFEAVLLAGLAILLWTPRATVRICLLAGFILGLSATIRQVGEILIIPLVIIVMAGALLARGGWRQVPGQDRRPDRAGVHHADFLVHVGLAVHQRTFLAVAQRPGIGLRPAVGPGRLRHAQDPVLRAAAVPDHRPAVLRRRLA